MIEMLHILCKSEEQLNKHNWFFVGFVITSFLVGVTSLIMTS